jgi:hypothetical protein
MLDPLKRRDRPDGAVGVGHRRGQTLQLGQPGGANPAGRLTSCAFLSGVRRPRARDRPRKVVEFNARSGDPETQEVLDGGRSQGELVLTGGRVLNVVGTGADVAVARAAAYKLAGTIEIRGGWYRPDIAASQ